MADPLDASGHCRELLRAIEREDSGKAGGQVSGFERNKNTNQNAFAAFMSNRAAVERFRAQVALYVGQPQGPDPADPTGTLGLHPGAF